MRKTLALILSALMVISLLCMGITVNAAPEGTAIKTASEFATMTPDGTYYLDADITISTSYAQKFTGTFDGNGHTVTVSCPMFKVFDGIVKNLTVNGTITAEDGLATAAFAVRSVDGMYAENVTTNVNITLSGDKRGMYAAGILATDNIVAGDNTEYYAGAQEANNKNAPSVFINCKNTGNIIINSTIPVDNTATTASNMKARAAGIAAVVEGCVCINCENTGNVTIPINELEKKVEGETTTYAFANTQTGCIAGGIVARHSLSATNGEGIFLGCKNSGEITAAGHAAGICGYFGQGDNNAFYKCYGCVNTGKIIGANQVGGIVAYCYAGGKANIDMEFCLNTGDILYGDTDNSNFGSPFYAYSNCTKNATVCCINTGKVYENPLEGLTAVAHAVIGCSSADPINYYSYFNILYDPDGHFTMWSYAADEAKYAANRHTMQEGIDAGLITVVTTLDDVKSGKYAYELNQQYYEDNIAFAEEGWDGTLSGTIEYSAIKADTTDAVAKVTGSYDYSYIWHQTIGVDEVPTVENKANTFVDYKDGKYVNVAALPIAAEEETTVEETTAKKADDTTAVAGDETTAAAPEETTAGAAVTSEAPKSSGGCGSVVGIGVAIVAILGTAIVAKKKF